MIVGSFVFVHRKPVGRTQVLKLRHTMDTLLEKITIEDSDLHGQTQVFISFSVSPLLMNMICFLDS